VVVVEACSSPSQSPCSSPLGSGVQRAGPVGGGSVFGRKDKSSYLTDRFIWGKAWKPMSEAKSMIN